MKRIIIILSILLVYSVNVQSQTYYYRSDGMNKYGTDATYKAYALINMFMKYSDLSERHKRTTTEKQFREDLLKQTIESYDNLIKLKNVKMLNSNQFAGIVAYSATTDTQSFLNSAVYKYLKKGDIGMTVGAIMVMSENVLSDKLKRLTYLSALMLSNDIILNHNYNYK